MRVTVFVAQPLNRVRGCEYRDVRRPFDTIEIWNERNRQPIPFADAVVPTDDRASLARPAATKRCGGGGADAPQMAADVSDIPRERNAAFAAIALAQQQRRIGVRTRREQAPENSGEQQSPMPKEPGTRTVDAVVQSLHELPRRQSEQVAFHAAPQ